MRWVFAFILLLTAGCGAEVPNAPDEVVQERLAAAAKKDPAPYYLGNSHLDLKVTNVLEATEADPVTTITYGTCRLPAEGEGGCAPPYQVQTRAFDSHPWGPSAGCTRLDDIRGVPAVDLGDSVALIPQGLEVRVFPDGLDPAKARAAAEALRPIGSKAGTPLPRPDAATLKVIGTACGNSPGEHG